jgi:hypothetical protein
MAANFDAAWIIPENYNATTNLPEMPTKRVKMLQALQSGLLPLMELLYDMAARDDSNAMKSSMQKMLDDRRRGKWVAFDLLKSMSIQAIEACILNTVGTRYMLDPTFRTQFYRMNDTCGVYVNTIMLRNRRGRFLNAHEYNDLSEMISAYIASEGVENDADAMKIDCAYWNTPDQRQISRRGTRRFISGKRKTERMARNLADRSRTLLGLDPTGNARTTQSPLEVGFSIQLATRVRDHSLESNLSTTTKPWGLVLSCLKAMGLAPEIVCVPILQIWNEKQRALGEILVTMLAGSMICDGGFNPEQPGVSTWGRKEGFELERQSVFCNKTWLFDNQQAVDEELAEREGNIETARRITAREPENAVLETNKLMTTLERNVKTEAKTISDALAKSTEVSRRLETGKIILDKTTERLQASLNFRSAIRKCLESSSIEPPDEEE